MFYIFGGGAGVYVTYYFLIVPFYCFFFLQNVLPTATDNDNFFKKQIMSNGDTIVPTL